jgi:hypothetical protein
MKNSRNIVSFYKTFTTPRDPLNYKYTVHKNFHFDESELRVKMAETEESGGNEKRALMIAYYDCDHTSD